MENLQKKLGYNFRNPKLLQQALTHSSYTANIHCNYERLEFLGDRILGVTIAEMLCTTFPNDPEGNLSQRFVSLVCKETVAEVSSEIGLNKYIITANPEITDSINVLCDVGEAIIASIYIDSQDMSIAQDFIKHYWTPLIDKKSQPHKDFKSLLQEKAASLKLDFPCYKIIQKTGPEHNPNFVVEVSLNNGIKALGEGKSKKQAEQNSAKKMLDILGIKNANN